LNEEERVLTFQRQREKIKENGKRVYWKKSIIEAKNIRKRRKRSPCILEAEKSVCWRLRL
jgi:hypothetical protein